MGNYINPGNSGFSEIRNDIYVDKSGLISLINQTIHTPRRLTCISRPRRFGKSFAAQMLCAYYGKTCDSAELFDDLEIANDTQYQKHLNQYDVIYLDMTGILPIKKDGSQSAISDFWEYSMIKPRQFGKYVGFTKEEVKRLCKDYGSDFDSYWTQTSAAESLMGYISLDFDGLGRTMAELIGGVKVKVNTDGFANDLVTFRDKNDVLTLLIHLGYLAYDENTQKVYIPNEEIRLEFAKTVRQVKRNDTIRRVRESDQLIEDTIHGREEAVARQIEKIHEEESALHYNNEQALRSVIKRAYFSYGDEYLLFEELPAGVGYADLVYLPKKNSMLPILVIELKWNQSAKGAIAQIKDRRYAKTFKEYGSDILLVGISYNRKALAGERKHWCKIEKYKEHV